MSDYERGDDLADETDDEFAARLATQEAARRDRLAHLLRTTPRPTTERMKQ